jgi:uncharacterized membrane protein
MKKVLLTILAVLVVLGTLAGAGFTGYQMGYRNGTGTSGNTPFFNRSFHMNPDQMPMHRFGNDSGRWSMPYHSPMMGRGGGFGFFSPLHFLWNIVVIGLIIWFVYWLVTKSGWKITRNTGKDPEQTGN